MWSLKEIQTSMKYFVRKIIIFECMFTKGLKIKASILLDNFEPVIRESMKQLLGQTKVWGCL